MSLAGFFDELRSRSVPLAGSLELTHRCNLRCLHCYQFPPRADEREMDTVQVVRLLEELRDAGTLFLGLTGGEPLLREDLGEILKAASDLDFALSLQTNAFLLDEEWADRLAGLGSLRVDVSLHAASEDAHDAFCGVRGSFRAALRALEMLEERGVPCMTKTVVTRLNLRELEDIARLAEERGAAAFFSPIIFPRNDGGRSPLRFRLADEELEEFAAFQADHLRKMLGEGAVGGAGPGERMMPDPPGCGESVPDARGRALRGCGAGRSSFCINPYGDVHPCVAWPLVVGNVLKSGFRRIWEGSPLLEELREKEFNLDEECLSCQYLERCPTCRALSWLEEGDPGAVSRERCRLTKSWMRGLSDGIS